MSTTINPYSLSSMAMPTGAVGSSGQYLVSNGHTGSGSINWADGASTITATAVNNTLTVKGDAEFNGRVKIDGVDIGETILRIEARLNILRPNQELEGRWEQLKELGDRYRELEADILGKEELINILSR